MLYMKKIFNISVLAVLLVVSPNPCSAMMELADFSKERAKELGMEVRSEAHGPDQVWVELTFKTEGELKNFGRVELEIREGKKFLLVATLKEDQYRAKPGQVVVGFTVDRTLLDKASLVVVAGRPMDMTGYLLRIKDFVEPGKAR